MEIVEDIMLAHGIDPKSDNGIEQALDSQDCNYALYLHFTESGEMPYGTMKARDGDPDDWMACRLERLLGC